MKMTYQIEALTPIFSFGSDPFQQGDRRANKPDHDGVPEIRPASIRGQLRWWMEAIGTKAQVGGIFGVTAGDSGTASKVSVRVDGIEGTITKKRCTQHKSWSIKTCYDTGTRFDLIISERRKGLTDEERAILKETVEAWLLLGTLGGRGTRAAGSLQDANHPLTEAEWKHRCQQLLRQSPLHLRLSRESFQTEEAARHLISDTLDERAFNGAQPLGGIRPRKTSPLRMRVVEFADASEGNPYRIAAVWTEKDRGPLHRALQTLCRHTPPKRIGEILQNGEIVVE